MKPASLSIRKQPPAAVLLDELFDFVVESNAGEEDVNWAVDHRMKLVEAPRKAKNGTPTSFRGRFIQSYSGVALTVSLIRKDGSLCTSATTTQISTVSAKVQVSKTEEWTDVWFKDEGGREKCMELIAGVYNQKREVIKSMSTMQVTLCYATNHHGTVRVANQDILRLLNTDLHTGPDGTVRIRYRVEDVSKNHQGQDFCLLVGAINADRLEVAHGVGPPVKIRSKRNKRGRGAAQNATGSKPTKKAAVGPEDHSLQEAFAAVSKWAEDVARAMYPWQQGNAAFRQLLLRYDKHVRLEVRRVENMLPTTKARSPPIIYPSPQPVPSTYSGRQPWVPGYHHGDGFPHWSPGQYQSHFPGHVIRPPAGEGSSPPKANKRSIELVVGKECEVDGKVMGLPAFSHGEHLLGFFRSNGMLEREFDASHKAMALSILREKEAPVFTKRNDGPKFVQHAFSHVRCSKIPPKPMNEVKVPIGTPKTPPPKPRHQQQPKQVVPLVDQDMEADVKCIIAQTFKSTRTGEVLGFPAFSETKQLIGFYQQNQNGVHHFIPLSPDEFCEKKLREATRVLEQAGDAVQMRADHGSVFDMINHALVYEFSHDIKVDER